MKIFNTEVKVIQTAIYGKTYACYKTGGKNWGTAFLTPSLFEVLSFILS